MQEPTTNRAQLTSAIDSLTARGRTAIYDAVVRGAEALGDDGVRSMVLLTDGDEKGSQRTIDDADGGARGLPISASMRSGFQSNADPRTWHVWQRLVEGRS